VRPRIALPVPHSFDQEYAARALPQYEKAIELGGGQPVRIAIPAEIEDLENLVGNCQAILLPGSKADVDPARFEAPRSPHTAFADEERESVDSLLLDHAYRFCKPVLGICYGLQSLNVYRGGSLIQHIPDFLPDELRARVNHAAGRATEVAHDVMIEGDSTLSRIVRDNSAKPLDRIPVNSSHHQSAHSIGAGLRVVARCPDDEIVEAVEGTDENHFVLGVQWHPERSIEKDEPSRAIFRALVDAARRRKIR